MIPFDYQPGTRIVFGPDKIDALGELARELGARRALVVSDPGVIAAGHMQRGVDSLQAAGVFTFHFDHVHENPSTRDVAAAVEVARQCRPDLLVGLGGGSSMDCAKGLNFIYTNGGEMRDYWGVGKATRPMLPMIAVPTTAGTGSETQSFALISDAETHAKMACGDRKAACRVALLDPKLTLTQPRRVTALTGIDALAHALETFVTRRRTPLSLAFSRESWRLLSTNFARVLDEPDNLDARAAMQLGACYAGIAIENSMLGATHALANPLTAEFGVVHGQAIGVMLPHVVRFNGAEYPHWYQELMQASGLVNGSPDAPGCVDLMADFISGLVAKAGLAVRLSECGVSRASFGKLADDAARQWTGTFNPRPVEAADLHELYDRAF
ncbi:MAG: iron-containing alcohol dehydrogenase [Pirellulaceae bacterium]|nr:iron-containing alcohol dehydrogenase [Pirellulaceae bacterium]